MTGVQISLALNRLPVFVAIILAKYSILLPHYYAQNNAGRVCKTLAWK